MFRLIVCTMIAVLVSLTGCAAHYAAPGHGADMRALGVMPVTRPDATDPSLKSAFDTRPMAQLPASIAVVRIQESGYSSQTAQTWGGGKFCVVLTRDVESSDAFEKLDKLKNIAGIAPMGRLLLPEEFKSIADLRFAAAQLHADMLLVYTFDTNFYQNDLSTPLSLVTLGLAPDHKIRVVATASAILIDTRDGYIYGMAEATDAESNIATSWNTDSAVDASRRKAESESFDKLEAELEKTWIGVVHQINLEQGRATN